MKDRVPTKPNRYAVYDDNHNFLRYEYHERADEPTQAGTPINKATMLKDATALSLGLPLTAAPDNALALLAQNVILIKTSMALTLPKGLKTVSVLCAGGGGGGYPSTSGHFYYGGGGGGFIAINENVNVEGLSTVNCVIGAGGNPGSAGGTTSFLTASAQGGAGGTRLDDYSSRGGNGNGGGGSGCFGGNGDAYGGGGGISIYGYLGADAKGGDGGQYGGGGGVYTGNNTIGIVGNGGLYGGNGGTKTLSAQNGKPYEVTPFVQLISKLLRSHILMGGIAGKSDSWSGGGGGGAGGNGGISGGGGGGLFGFGGHGVGEIGGGGGGIFGNGGGAFVSGNQRYAGGGGSVGNGGGNQNYGGIGPTLGGGGSGGNPGASGCIILLFKEWA